MFEQKLSNKAYGGFGGVGDGRVDLHILKNKSNDDRLPSARPCLHVGCCYDLHPISTPASSQLLLLPFAFNTWQYPSLLSPSSSPLLCVLAHKYYKVLADSDLLSNLTGFSLIEPIKNRGSGNISKQQKKQNYKKSLYLYSLLSL